MRFLPRRLKDPPARVLYKNYRGETAVRTIVPLETYYGTDKPFHTEAQWLMLCWDVDKEGYRTYALAQCDFMGVDAHGTGNTDTGEGVDFSCGVSAPGQTGEGAHSE